MNHGRGMSACFIMLLLLSGNVVTSAFGQGVPEEARRFMARGIAAVELAKTPDDYARAVREFEQAARLATNWPDVYFNLGAVQAKAGNYAESMRYYRRYLELAPNAPDAARVRDEIYKLEYRADQPTRVSGLGGTWTSTRGPFTITVEGGNLTARWQGLPTGVDVKVKTILGWRDGVAQGTMEEVFTGSVDGMTIRGTRRRLPFSDTVTKCEIPADQSEFTGTVSDDGRSLTLRYTRSLYVTESGSTSSLTCTGVTKTGESPEVQLTLYRTYQVPLATVRVAIALPADSLNAYVGTYRLAPTIAISIRKDSTGLIVQVTGQGASRIFPSARDEFFFRMVDAQISFVRDSRGKVASLVLHQGGRDLPAPRIP